MNQSFDNSSLRRCTQARAWVLHHIVFVVLISSLELAGHEWWPDWLAGWGGLVPIALTAAFGLSGMRRWYESSAQWWLAPLLVFCIGVMPVIIMVQDANPAMIFLESGVVLWWLVLITPLSSNRAPDWQSAMGRFWLPAGFTVVAIGSLKHRFGEVAVNDIRLSLALATGGLWLAFLLHDWRMEKWRNWRVLAAMPVLLLLFISQSYSEFGINDYFSVSIEDLFSLILSPFEAIGLAQSADLMYWLTPDLPFSTVADAMGQTLIPPTILTDIVGLSLYSPRTIIAFIVLGFVVLSARSTAKPIIQKIIVGSGLMTTAVLMSLDYINLYSEPFPISHLGKPFTSSDRIWIYLPPMAALSLVIMLGTFEATKRKRMWPELRVAFRWAGLYLWLCLGFSAGIAVWAYTQSDRESIKQQTDNLLQTPTPAESLYSEIFLSSNHKLFAPLPGSLTMSLCRASSGLGIRTTEEAMAAQMEYNENLKLMRDIQIIASAAGSFSMDRAKIEVGGELPRTRYMYVRQAARFLSGQVEASLVLNDVSSAVEHTSTVLRLCRIIADPRNDLVDNMIGVAVMAIAQASAQEILTHIDQMPSPHQRLAALEALDRALTIPGGFTPILTDAYAPLRKELAPQFLFQRLMILNFGSGMTRAMSESHQRATDMLWLRAMVRLRLFREATGRFPESPGEMIATLPRGPEDGVIDFLNAPWWQYFSITPVGADSIVVEWLLPVTHPQFGLSVFDSPQQIQWSPDGFSIQAPPNSNSSNPGGQTQ